MPPVKTGGVEVAVRLAAWRSEDGLWRGRLLFGAADASELPATADIFCAATEQDLWQSVRDLREHHVRDLYRAVTQ